MLLYVTLLHVLGTCAGWPEPGRACSGYVLEHAGAFLVLDLGFGTLGRLLHVVPRLESIVGVAVTHAHPDHVSDVIGLCRAATLTGARPAWPLIAPEGVRETVAAGDPDGGEATVDQTLHAPVLEGQVGPFGITTHRTPHYLPNLAVRVEVDGRVLVYTGDTGPHDELSSFARDADLLLAECTDRHQQGGEPDRETRRYLMTAGDAGRLASQAEVGSLLLTHFWPGNDREQSRREASAAYGGSVSVTEDTATYTVGASIDPRQGHTELGFTGVIWPHEHSDRRPPA